MVSGSVVKEFHMDQSSAGLAQESIEEPTNALIPTCSFPPTVCDYYCYLY